MKGEFRQSAVFRKKGETGQYPSGYTLAAEPGTAEYERENKCLVSDSLLWMDVYKELEDEFGESIKHILKKKHLTQEALAGMLGVSSKALYNYLNSDKWSGFLNSLELFSDDFMSDGREQPAVQEREAL